MAREISAERVERMQRAGEAFTLVDTRPEGSFEAWHMPGVVNFTFGKDESLAGERAATFERQVDGDHPIVTVCAKGISSQHFADELASAGYDDVAVIEGGMEAWSAVYDVVPITLDGVEILQIQRRAKGCLGYVVCDPESGEAAVIDATRHTDEFREAARERDYEITAVLDTHVHADHVSGGRGLASELGVPYYLGERARDRGLAYEYTPLGRNDVLEIGEVELKALFAPGHTGEMVNYLIGREALLSSDTLFVDGTGRTELEFSEDAGERGARMQYESIHRTLLAEPDSITLLPGHVTVTSEGEFEGGTPGEAIRTTVGELRTGLDVLALDEAAFVERSLETLPEKPPNYERVIDINRGVEMVDDEEVVELELGPNNCSA
ncbi:MBL fold metallo-hydrolase [Halalkalicoccus jeotgali]|uniref:Beta-lactamase domain protein n=1 Tax=Halalkalicoccus jeotgali (strain DSM 18796 / CECT 7217 / JCM 14584 / KCTC 4019 / B3) TaxID=795797 RepID=D8J8D5_HALJB|nr:rhodanese-like domain-containing protein [Halalkalicoccus jeotgali]ADJ16181.1 beta-lactamase domain protein [Halalkalicoccus jeotgali B3]ELY37609.1 beta-lactamase domain-containing protein [Halalkalicoccus jeotgali B3]